MKFIHYISPSIVDSFDSLFETDEYVVYLNDTQHYLAVKINNDVYAVFLWDNFELLHENDMLSTAKLQMAEAKLIYQDTLQVVFDKFPKTIKNEVFMLVHTYHSNRPYDRYDSQEVIDKQINPHGYNIVKLYSNSNNDNWWVFLCEKLLFSLNNEKAAKRIYQLILSDSLSLIQERWK